MDSEDAKCFFNIHCESKIWSLHTAEKSAAKSDCCNLHIYSVYQVHDQMHLSSWLVEAYMRFLYFSELNHNSEFISAFKGGVSYSFFIIVSPSWFGLTVSVEHLIDITTQDQPCSACKTVTSHSSGVCRLSVFLISGLRVAAMPANTSTPLAFVLVFCCSSHCHSSSRAALYCQSVSGFVR